MILSPKFVWIGNAKRWRPISLASAWSACALESFSLPAAVCAVAVIAGKITASACGTQGLATLLLIMGPPAIDYCWRESSTAMRMFGDTFGRGQGTPIVVAQELQ